MIGIVICSRLSSKRIPKKPHVLIENKTIISHLVSNISSLDIPIFIAVPSAEYTEYIADKSLRTNESLRLVNVFGSDLEHDPLARMYQVAKQYSLKTIIRITHDKIFVDTECLKEALICFKKEKADYLYSSSLLPGTNFEIISFSCLSRASEKFKNVEFISYAARNTSNKTVNFTFNQHYFNFTGLNLLIDNQEDVDLFRVIYSRLGVDCRLKDVLSYLNKNREVLKINKSPIVTIYTCAYNSEKFIKTCIDSVFSQSIIDDCEYIVIDDCSNDKTFEIAKVCSIDKNNFRVFRNERNVGLSSSSNIALEKAKGKFIIRIDSDDYFSNEFVISEMLEYITKTNDEILYPDNYFGSKKNIQKGDECHHVGGALFNKSALNFIKFTDGLRGFEGYDLFKRAENKLKIGYFKKPSFFYTQRKDSMSKTDLKEREIIKKEIDKRCSDEKV